MLLISHFWKQLLVIDLQQKKQQLTKNTRVRSCICIPHAKLQFPTPFMKIKYIALVRINCFTNVTVSSGSSSSRGQKMSKLSVSPFSIFLTRSHLFCTAGRTALYIDWGPEKGTRRSAINSGMTDTLTSNWRELAVPRGHSSTRGTRDTTCGVNTEVAPGTLL